MSSTSLAVPVRVVSSSTAEVAVSSEREPLKLYEQQWLAQQRQYGPSQSVAPLNVNCGGFGGI